MDFEPEIEFYAENDNEIVLNAVFGRLSQKEVLLLEKKLDQYRKLSMETLMRTGTLDFINGSKPRLYELKIKNLRTPVRFVCAIEKRTIVLLDVLFTSGAHGAVEKHLARAEARLNWWRMKN